MRRALSWLRNATIMAGLVARQGVVSFRYNWGIALLSLVLAVSLWVYVTDRENPDVTDWVPATVAIEVANPPPPGRDVFPPLQESVSVRVRAPESVFERLTAEDFRATVDLTDVTGLRATVDVNVESLESRAVVVDFTPETITVVLENVVERTVPVRAQLVGVPPRGFEAREITTEPVEAVVTGPESLVGRVVAVEADVNLTGIRSDFERSLLLQARDAVGVDIHGVNVEPETALVQAQVVQLEFSVDIIVRPDVSGLPAAGYNVASVRADPATIVVTATFEVLQGIDVMQGILTETVSIEGRTAGVDEVVTLLLPEGASADQTTVTVQVTIEAARGQFSFDVVPQVTNLGIVLIALVSPPTVRVVLEGAVPDLRAISVSDILADIDLDGLGAGDHVVPVRVQAPPGTTLISISPPEVSVTLSLP